MISSMLPVTVKPLFSEAVRYFASASYPPYKQFVYTAVPIPLILSTYDLLSSLLGQSIATPFALKDSFTFKMLAPSSIEANTRYTFV